MKKLLLFLFLISSALSACSYNGQILIQNDTSPTSLKGKYGMKAAIAIAPHQKNEVVSVPVFWTRVEINSYPNLYHALRERLQRVFSDVEIVDEQDVNVKNYDVLINTKLSLDFHKQLFAGVFDESFKTVGYDLKNGQELFRTSSQRSVDYSPPTGALLAGFVTGATLFLASPITIPLANNSIGSYAEETLSGMISKSLDETVDQIMNNRSLWIYAEGNKFKPKDVEIPLTLVGKSDVDTLPATKHKSNKNAYAIVIGIEQYRQKLPRADFATNDAQRVTEYLTQVLGYPEENVITLLNDHASSADLAKNFEKWLPNNVENGGSVFVYYSGHGSPDPKTGDTYIVPYDGDPSFIEQTGYSLLRMYTALAKLPAKQIIVALDSCFSGAGGRSVLAPGTRPIVISVANPVLLSKKIVAMSASAGNQISTTYGEKGHGLFTYFMLKGIKSEDFINPDGSILIHDLFTYIKPQVERIARKIYNVEQSPQIIGQGHD